MGLEFDWKDEYTSSVSLMIKVEGPKADDLNARLLEEFKDCLEEWHVDKLCFSECLEDLSQLREAQPFKKPDSISKQLHAFEAEAHHRPKLLTSSDKKRH